MAAIKGRNTKPELILRKGLHAKGLRFRLRSPSLPGKPDLIFPRYRAAVFVHGCFWHFHQCHLSKIPNTRTEFWNAKLEKNRLRDSRAQESLHASGWRCLVVWECALRGKFRVRHDELFDEISEWIQSEEFEAEFAGRPQ